MFTTDSGFGWQAHPAPLGTVTMGDRKVYLSNGGIDRLVERMGNGEDQQTAIHNVLYKDRDFAFDIMGWWIWTGKNNPWRIVGRVQITRTVEHGRAHYCATSMICDHTSTTLAHLLGRLGRMQFGSAKRERERKRNPEPRYRQMSESEVWQSRYEQGWGPGGY